MISCRFYQANEKYLSFSLQCIKENIVRCATNLLCTLFSKFTAGALVYRLLEILKLPQALFCKSQNCKLILLFFENLRFVTLLPLEFNERLQFTIFRSWLLSYSGFKLKQFRLKKAHWIADIIRTSCHIVKKYPPRFGLQLKSNCKTRLTIFNLRAVTQNTSMHIKFSQQKYRRLHPILKKIKTIIDALI